MRSVWAVAIVALAVTTARAEPVGGDAPKLESPYAIVIDAVTGDELLAKHPDDVRPIASMTKIRGGKTGWTEDAGYCMIVSAEIGGRSEVIRNFLTAAATRRWTL